MADRLDPAIADDIAARIDWNPTCRDGETQRVIVQQLAYMLAVQPRAAGLEHAAREFLAAVDRARAIGMTVWQPVLELQLLRAALGDAGARPAPDVGSERNRLVSVIEEAMPADTVWSRDYGGPVGIAPDVGDLADTSAALWELVALLGTDPAADVRGAHPAAVVSAIDTAPAARTSTPDDADELLLVCKPGRRGGAVTVGHSRLPLAPLWAHAVGDTPWEDVARVYPSVTEAQWRVISRAVADLGHAAEPEPDDAIDEGLAAWEADMAADALSDDDLTAALERLVPPATMPEVREVVRRLAAQTVPRPGGLVDASDWTSPEDSADDGPGAEDPTGALRWQVRLDSTGDVLGQFGSESAALDVADRLVPGRLVTVTQVGTPDAEQPRPVCGDVCRDLADANERMGEALVAIGMALGLPRPSVGATWGAPEILARIAEVPSPVVSPDSAVRSVLTALSDRYGLAAALLDQEAVGKKGKRRARLHGEAHGYSNIADYLLALATGPTPPAPTVSDSKSEGRGRDAALTVEVHALLGVWDGVGRRRAQEGRDAVRAAWPEVGQRLDDLLETRGAAPEETPRPGGDRG